MKRLAAWIASALIFVLLVGCANVGSYVKDHYPLVDVQGKGKDAAKVYLAEGKHVPEVASELASREKPEEKSKESEDRMFLVYSDKIVNVQKDPQNDNNSLVEIDSIEYARDHYDSSFLQGYLTASLLQHLFGGGWFGSGHSTGYRGYNTLPQTYSSPGGSAAGKSGQPSTSDRTGSFSGTKSAGSVSGTASGGSSGSTGSFTSGSSGSSVRKSDGSTPIYKAPSNPRTSSRSGSFTRRRK